MVEVMSKFASASSSAEPSLGPTCLHGVHVMYSVGMSCYALNFTAHDHGANLQQHMEMHGRACSAAVEKNIYVGFSQYVSKL